MEGSSCEGQKSASEIRQPMESVAAFVIRHDDCADEIDDDGRSGQQGEDDESDSKEIGVNIEVLRESSKDPEEPLVGG